jgi:uncharacterized phage infection (PIP) family protein YhgE
MFRRKTQPNSVSQPNQEFHDGEDQFKKVVQAVKQLDQLLKEYKDIQKCLSEDISNTALEKIIDQNFSDKIINIPFPTIGALIKCSHSLQKNIKFFEDHFMGRPVLR